MFSIWGMTQFQIRSELINLRDFMLARMRYELQKQRFSKTFS